MRLVRWSAYLSPFGGGYLFWNPRGGSDSDENYDDDEESRDDPRPEVPICADATIVSPLHRDGMPWPTTPETDGASFARAMRAKEDTYPELAEHNPYGKLTVLACETGGRWHDTARGMIAQLVTTRTQNVHPLLRRAAGLAYQRRWWSLLSVALQRTVTTSLLDHPGLGCMPGT